MKRLTTILVILLAVTLMAGCSPFVTISTGGGPSLTGSHKLVEKTFDLAGFTAVDASAGAAVEISKADGPSVKVTVDDNIADYVRVEKRGNTLVIGMKNGSFKNFTLKAAVALPELLGVSASGGSKVTFDDFTTTKPVAFNLSGGAGITGKMTAGPTKVKSSGGANVTLTGQGQALTLNHSGGGNVKLGGYQVTDANVDVSGGSQSEISASGKVTGSVSGGGTVKLVGQPSSVDVRKSGGGAVLE